MKNALVLVLAYFTLFGAFILASPLLLASNGENSSLPEQALFVSPNEQNPLAAKKILAHAPEGAYVSLGTERALIGYALTPSANFLVAIDRTPGITLFNQFNFALIHLSEDLETYRKLRMEPHKDLFLKLVNQLKEKRDKHSLMPFLTLENYNWFQLQRQDNRELNEHFYLNRTSIDDFEKIPKAPYQVFYRANYMAYSKQFKRVKTMIDEERFLIRQLTISGKESPAFQFISWLKSRNLKVSVFDFSNSISPRFMTLDTAYDFLSNVESVLQPNSIILVTFKSVISQIIDIFRRQVRWRYLGFQWSVLKRSILLTGSFNTNKGMNFWPIRWNWSPFVPNKEIPRGCKGVFITGE